jgi:hypothetical protein
MRRMLFCTAMLLSLTINAAAVTIYAPNGLERPLDGPDALIVFDSADPAGYTTIGSMLVPNIGFGGMEFDRDGNLWAYASFYKSTGGAAGGLYSVDIATGAATVQGTLSSQPLEDLAYSPTDDTMYGIRTQNNVTKLYTVDLTTGATAPVGVFTGLPSEQHAMSFAVDSAGCFYVHELGTDRIYKGAGLALTELYQLPQDTNFSQGMTIDWSRDDQGYHAAVGYGDYPHYFSQLNTFATDGSAYTLGPDFGPDLPDGLPPVEPGDVAIMPVPEPSSLLLITIGVLLRRR